MGGGTENTTYYFVNAQLIAKKDTNGTKTYFHNDHLGSTSIISNQAGSLVEATSYDPWGTVKTGGTASKFLYTGQEKDSETGLHYYNARYYAPGIRRFTQPDSYTANIYDPQDLNAYSYVLNNPLRYTDPSGHAWQTITTGIKPLDLGLAILAAGAYYFATPQGQQLTKTTLNTTVSIAKQATTALLNKNTSPPAPVKTNITKTSGTGNTQGGGSPKGQNPLQKIAPIIPSTFATAEKLQDHFNRHAGELGFKTIEEYVEGAKGLFNGGSGVDAAIRKNGDALFIRESTKEFGILTKDDIIRTYYKATGGIDYFLRELTK